MTSHHLPLSAGTTTNWKRGKWIPQAKRRRRCALPSHSKWLFVVAWSTLAAARAAMSFELRFQLIELRLLLSCQNGQHLLTKGKSRAHRLCLQACHFRQFLSSQRFIERTAFTRLAQLLPLRPKLFKQWFVAFHRALTDLFHLRFLIIS